MTVAAAVFDWGGTLTPWHTIELAEAWRAIGLGDDAAERLEETGLRVLVDDRDASAGVKLTDAELLGVPHVVVVGRRSGEGVVEVRDRATGEAAESRLDDVIWAVTA